MTRVHSVSKLQFFKRGGGWQFNKFVPDVLESGLTVAVSYTKLH